MNYKYILLLVSVTLMGCSRVPTPPIQVSWEHGGNDVLVAGICESFLTITNTSSDTLFGVDNTGNPTWGLYYALMSIKPLAYEGEPLHTERIMSSYHCATPTSDFQPLAPGESSRIKVLHKGYILRQSDGPQGLFFVRYHNGKPTNDVVAIDCQNVPFSRLEQMTRGVEFWEKTPYSDGEYVYAQNDRFTDTTTNYHLLPVPKEMHFTAGQCVQSKTPLVEHIDTSFTPEKYSIDIRPDSITLTARDERGFFYAKQTLAQLPDTLACGTITDYPDMSYRGVMFDIARHFTPKEDIECLIDVLSAYKINVLHLHLCDDEAWRLEIAGLPELTTCGATKGYEIDSVGELCETHKLFPFYCGGIGNKDDGYLSRQDFIELLGYAKAHAMRILPEVDMPGHMRACKKVMHGLLTDSALEQREYISAQSYTDNVIAVTNPYALTFIKTVIKDIVSMYSEAGCELEVFNIGGDEVPVGALTREEHQTFLDSVLNVLQEYHLRPAGWEEMTHFCDSTKQPLCYCWHAGESKARELIGQGYDVIQCNADRLYFDFAYCNHHEERGLMWGGYTDEWKAFEMQPIVDGHVKGLQAQLWGEVLRSYDQIEWQLFPKVFGLSERAWNNNSTLTLNEFNSIVYNDRVPDLVNKGHNCHLPLVGIHILGDLVVLNSPVGKAQLYYAVNPSADEQPQWHEYEKPFNIDVDTTEVLCAKMCYVGKTSGVTWYFVRGE